MWWLLSRPYTLALPGAGCRGGSSNATSFYKIPLRATECLCSRCCTWCPAELDWWPCPSVDPKDGCPGHPHRDQVSPHSSAGWKCPSPPARSVLQVPLQCCPSLSLSASLLCCKQRCGPRGCPAVGAGACVRSSGGHGLCEKLLLSEASYFFRINLADLLTPAWLASVSTCTGTCSASPLWPPAKLQTRPGDSR